MPALIDRYNKVSDQSRELFPLLECLSYVALALGDSFSPYAPTIFLRCVNIIHVNLEQTLASAANPALDTPEKDFLITSLDLLSAIIQALDGAKSQELVETSQQSFFELLSFCMEDPTDEVRQSAYALVGDCAKYVFPQLRQYLPNMLPLLLKQLDLDSVLDEDMDSGFGVVNNACWSAGEIALQHRKEMSPWISQLATRFIEILGNPRVPKGLQENAAVALGRLGIDNADQLAGRLPEFADDFLNAMLEFDASEEKGTAFKGFSMIVAQNPQSIEKVLLDYFVAIARYQDMSLSNPIKQELHDVFQNVCQLIWNPSSPDTPLEHVHFANSQLNQIIKIYKHIIPQFDDFINRMQPNDQQTLRQNYTI
jgi:hypothetical protein